MMVADESAREKLERYVVALEAYRAHAQSLAKDLQVIRANVENLSLAKLTLEQCSSLARGSELLIPVGGSAYIRGKITDNKKAIVAIGSGVFVEEKIEDCIRRVDKQIAVLRNAEQQLRQKITAVESEAEKISEQIELLAAKQETGR